MEGIDRFMIVAITKTIDCATLPDDFHTIVYSFSDNRKSWYSPLKGFISYADVGALGTAIEPFFKTDWNRLWDRPAHFLVVWMR